MTESNKEDLVFKRNKLTETLRGVLDRWEESNKKPVAEFDRKASGLLKEQVSKIEAELDQLDAEIDRSVAKDRADAKQRELDTPVMQTRKFAGGYIEGDDYNKRFANALFTGNKVAMDRIMSERHSGVFTSDTGVNSAIPTEWQNRIVEKINQMNVMRQLCPIRNVGADQKIVVGGALPTSYMQTEGVAPTVDSALTYTVETVGDSTAVCWLPVSKQFQNDAIGGLNYIVAKAGESIANKLEDQYLNGSGSGVNIAGLLSNTFSTTDIDSGGTAFTITSDNIINLAHGVAPQYRMRGSYLVSDALMKVIRQLKTTTNEYLWKPADRYSDIRDGVPSTLFGYPVYVSPVIQSDNTAGGTVALFGDFNYYEIYDRDGGASVMIDPYGLSTALTTRVVVSMRTGGVCTNKAAFCRYTI